jgi:hypothetical protein
MCVKTKTKWAELAKTVKVGGVTQALLRVYGTIFYGCQLEADVINLTTLSYTTTVLTCKKLKCPVC